MDNINGALGFRATLDIDDFNVSAQAMERRIRDVSNTAVSESAAMESSIQSFAQNGARYIVSYLVGQGMSSLLQSIVNTRGQFQQLEIAFETMLGSNTKAKALMDQMVETAAKTPFDLMGVAGGAKQLLAYGESADKVNDTLVRLGNIASGLSIPLQDIVYLYGTTMVQGRLYAQDVRQFTGRGIPLVKELAAMYGVTAEEINNMVSEGKIGFPEVEKVILKLTNSGGQFYNLMEKQSASLTGQMANLGDAWDSALNKLGTDNQDLFSGAISGATYLVENLDEILRIVKAITIAYGSYKAAIVLNTLVTKGYTGVALLDNTARQAKIALLKLDATVTGQAAAQTKAMTAAQEAHTASLQKQLTVEEQANLVKQLRIATINGLLTAQQQEYLSNLGLTASSQGYEAAAMGILTVEQREALSKTDLTAKSAIYRAALEQEVAKKTQNQAATLNAMRTEVSAAAAKVETAKQSAIATMQATEAARYEVYWAKQSGDAHRIAAAEKRLEAAQDNQALARKAALAAQTDFFAKKKALEAAATRQSTVATAADTTAKAANAAGTSILTAITTKATLAMKTLWASMMSNPIGWILGLVGALVSVFTLFTSKEEEATTVMGDFQDTTKKEIDNLDLLFAVLQNTEKGTKTHGDAIEKINAICKAYNKTLLDENATLDLQRQKYEELTTAIKNTTAEKIKAKYTEQAMQDMVNSQNDAMSELKDAVSDASYYQLEEVLENIDGVWVKMWKSVEHNSTNIRNASGAVWDAVEAEAVQAAKSLKGLTGDAYTEAYNQALERITNQVQQSTKATDKEMESFKESLDIYFADIVKASQKAQEEVAKVDAQLAEFYATETDAAPVVESVDYVSMSFEELEKKAKDTQAEIDKINAKEVKVETDNSKLTELLGILNQVNSAIDTKTDNLNTEAGINARIKQLKEERSNVEINGTKYKELSNTIAKLEAKLPKTTGGGNAAQKAEQLARKQLEAERKLEEDRIAIMEDGYAKRKALLDFQHRQNLAQIDKEEAELLKARQEAGKGGLSQTEKEGFQERRNIEDQSYERQQVKLLDEEIAYRKKQYELYYRWVDNMGKQVADTQFATLLKDGSSYAAWINAEIAKLEQKRDQNPNAFSAGDQENLFSLTLQRDEITGKRSAMDLFKESISQTVNQASTLAAKIEAIAEAKEKLARGEFKLNPDQTLQAQTELDTMDREAQQELNQAILDDFKSYEEKKNEIIANYNAMRLTQLAQNNSELLARINKGEADALSAINAEQLKASQEWKDLFTNLDVLTASEIERLIKKIEKAMSNSDLKLSPVDYQALLDSLNQAKDKVVELNPFKALGSAFDNYIKATKKLKNAEKENLSPEQIINLKKEIQNAAKQMVASIGEINQMLSSVGNSFSSLAASFGNDDLADTISGVTDVLGGAGQTAQGVGQIMSGDLLGGITSVVSGVTSVIGAFNKMHDKKNEKRIQRMQDQIDELADSYDNLSDAIARAYSTDKANMLEEQSKNLEQQNELIRKQIQEEKDKKDTDWDRIKEWEDQIAENEKQIAENAKYNIIEAIMGTEVATAIDDLATAYADAWASGEKAAGKSFNVVKSLIKTAIIEQLKNKLKPEVEKFMTYLAEAMEDGVISEAEERLLDRYEEAMESTADNYLSKNEKWLKDEEEDTQDPLTGAVRSLSEETGGVIAGKANAIVINQSEQMVIMRNQLVYQAEIAANTRASAERLANIESTLKRIENKDSSLLSQGIS